MKIRDMRPKYARTSEEERKVGRYCLDGNSRRKSTSARREKRGGDKERAPNQDTSVSVLGGESLEVYGEGRGGGGCRWEVREWRESSDHPYKERDWGLIMSQMKDPAAKRVSRGGRDRHFWDVGGGHSRKPVSKWVKAL